ncbi:MAG: DUF1631 family protein [Polaromonas sp.]|nr:DUF1631 family protein [Polaromonas sp.]
MNRVYTRTLGFADDADAARATRPGLQRCVETALNMSDGLIDSVIDGLEITVARAQGGAVASGPKSVMKLATEQLLANRVQIRATFAAQLRAAMYGGVKPEAQAQPLLRFDDFKLLPEDKLDENIEAAWAEQEIVLAVEDVLPTLDALVSTLLGWVTVQPQLNPLRPQVFVRALCTALVEQIPDTEIRGPLMTPAAGHLGTRMRKLYRELGEWLESQGIEPAGLPGTGVKARKGVMRGNPSAGDAGSSVAKTILTLDRLRKLLSGDLDGAPSGPQDFLYTVPASLDALQDMKMVEAMVQRLAKRTKEGGKAPNATKTPAGQTVDSKQIGKQLGEEVIRLMLESLIDDDRMLVKVRQILATLEPVLLQLAQTEPRFFSEKQHPARQFLDRVTHHSLAFTSESDEGFHKFMRAVEQAVSALLGMQKISAASFAQVLKILEDAWARGDKVQKARREEAAHALLHAEQRNLLAKRLSQEFRERMSVGENKDIPAFVGDFLCGPWAHAVAESQLVYTDTVVADPNGLVDELIWSVQPRVARLNRIRLVELVPSLLARLRQGLEVISYPPELTARFFDELISLHEAALGGTRIKHDVASDSVLPLPLPAPAGAQVAERVVEEVTEVPLVLAQEAAESGFIEEDAALPHDLSNKDEVAAEDAQATREAASLDSVPPSPLSAGAEISEAPMVLVQEGHESGFLEEEAVMPLDLSNDGQAPDPRAPAPVAGAELSTGMWVELIFEGKWVRAQLTWVSPHRNLFMFNSSGGKAHSMSRRTLDRLRTQGLMRVVSDGQLVDNALNAVAQVALRNSLA